MEKQKNIISFLAYVLLMLIFFGLGFFMGGYTAKPMPVVSATAPPENIMRASLPAVMEEKLLYTVKIENGKLLLYRMEKGKKDIIYSAEISESIFPPEDIMELKNGKSFDDIESANAFIENFAS